MTEREQVAMILERAISFAAHDDWGFVEMFVEDARRVLNALQEQDKDSWIVSKCRDGGVKKYVGNGVVILNYDWWRKILEGGFKIVPSDTDMEGE